jgi:hypothetical protein
MRTRSWWSAPPGLQTGAAPARLTHRCMILETGAENYRLREARRRRRGPRGSAGALAVDAGPAEV